MKPIRFSGMPVALWLALGSLSAYADLPGSYDLRDVDGVCYVTPIKSQLDGTCWTFGTMAAMEGNLLMTGAWVAAGEEDIPNLAEYHLDWWNGFNWHNNDDVPWPPHGLDVHWGGDYLVAAAYLTRGEGAVREQDASQFYTPSARWTPDYHLYYARDIEWYVAGEDLESIDTIKSAIMTHGAIGTCLASWGGGGPFWHEGGESFYQPTDSPYDPDHAVAIVGWDDDYQVPDAPGPGAWLCKNSWGLGWHTDGYFWISYYDKHCGQNPQMGAVSFQDVEPLMYDHIYYHDYHGWRATMTDCTQAFNAFTTTSVQRLEAVSFYTAAEDVTYTVTIYDRFEEDALWDELAVQSGTIAHRGFHTITLDNPVILAIYEDFYVFVELSHGGHAFDRTSDIPVLLGASARVVVESISHQGESFHYDSAGATWRDLCDYEDSPWEAGTASFCLKALATEYNALNITYPDGLPEYLAPNTVNHIAVEITDGKENYVPGTALLHYRYDDGDFESAPLIPLSDHLFRATLPPTSCGPAPEYYLSAQGDGGATVRDPQAPGAVYTATLGSLNVILHDDFEDDLGWTVASFDLVQGEWERVVPEGNGGTRLDPPEDYDGSGKCFVTGNDEWEDIDGGPTQLLSPSLDLSGVGEYTVTYARWFRSGNGIWDELTIEISNDDGDTWTIVEIVETQADWNVVSVLVSDFVTPTGQVRLRFSAEDDEYDSVTEAGLDAFLVTNFVCAPTYVPGDCNCDGYVDFFDIDAFVLALNDLAGYGTAYPDCNPLNADCNGDGAVDFFDIDAFVAILVG